MEDIKIVELISKDWKDLKNLRLKIMLTDPAAYALTYDESVNLPEEEWKKKLAKEFFLGAKIKNAFVGMIGVRFNTNSNESLAILLSVGVLKEYRKRGIAKKMMEELLRRLKDKGINSIKLWVSETQKPAISFYESFGFRFIGRKENEVNFNNETYDELIMEKELL